MSLKTYFDSTVRDDPSTLNDGWIHKSSVISSTTISPAIRITLVVSGMLFGAFTALFVTGQVLNQSFDNEKQILGACRLMGAVSGSVVGYLLGIIGSLYGPYGSVHSVLGGCIGYYICAYIVTEQSVNVTEKRLRSFLVLIYGSYGAVGGGLVGGLIGGGIYGIFGCFVGLFIPGTVAGYMEQTVHNFSSVDDRMYAFCAALGAVSGSAICSLFGVYSSLLVIPIFVLSVKVAAIALLDDLGESKIKASSLCARFFPICAAIGYFCGGISGGLYGLFSGVFSYICACITVDSNKSEAAKKCVCLIVLVCGTACAVGSAQLSSILLNIMNN